MNSEEFSVFLPIGKHFKKMTRPHNFDEKRVCKVGKPCLFTFPVGEPRVSRASFTARAITHFLVPRPVSNVELFPVPNQMQMRKIYCFRSCALVFTMANLARPRVSQIDGFGLVPVPGFRGFWF